MNLKSWCSNRTCAYRWTCLHASSDPVPIYVVSKELYQQDRSATISYLAGSRYPVTSACSWRGTWALTQCAWSWICHMPSKAHPPLMWPWLSIKENLNTSPMWKLPLLRYLRFLITMFAPFVWGWVHRGLSFEVISIQVFNFLNSNICFGLISKPSATYPVWNTCFIVNDALLSYLSLIGCVHHLRKILWNTVSSSLRTLARLVSKLICEEGNLCWLVPGFEASARGGVDQWRLAWNGTWVFRACFKHQGYEKCLMLDMSRLASKT